MGREGSRSVPLEIRDLQPARKGRRPSYEGADEPRLGPAFVQQRGVVSERMLTTTVSVPTTSGRLESATAQGSAFGSSTRCFKP